MNKLIKVMLCSILLLCTVGCNKDSNEATSTIESISTMNINVEKYDVYNTIEFYDYYIDTNENRTIYLSGSISEVYINDITLENYVSTEFNDRIESIIDNLELISTLKDGGTSIYKSEDKDITMIVCNTTKGDKDILIGDYSLEYTQGDCDN